MDTEDFVAGVIILAFFLAAVFGIGLVVGEVIDQNEFVSVCAYEGGEAKSDVCIKDNEVILTRKEYEDAQ